jgi:hypothetical protein
VCAHELWPMKGLAHHPPIPGVFICRVCYYKGRGLQIDPATHSAIAFTFDRDFKALFKKPTAVCEYQQHHK